jgi:hypothetical protein
MALEEIQRELLARHNLRISPAMSQYIIDKLKTGEAAEIPIIAGDARTGVPVRATIPLAALAPFATDFTPVQP